MGNGHDKKEAFPDLPEHLLVGFAIPDTEWTGNLATLSDKASDEIGNLLKGHLTKSELDQVINDLRHSFGTAVEMAEIECALRRAIGRESAGSKKMSAKLGVRLRSKLGKLKAEFAADAKLDGYGTCARIREDPLLESLVTTFLEEISGGKVLDPLRDSTSFAIQHLPQIVDRLFHAVDRGVVTGRAQPALNYLANSVVDALFRASGKTHGRTWDEYAGEEKGIGLKTCRILSKALNEALPDDSSQSCPADMVKPYRTAIKSAREAR